MQTHITNHQIRDETTNFLTTTSDDTFFFDYELSTLDLSFSDNFEKYYKIAGFTVFLSYDLNVTRLTQITFFEAFGIIGGLDYICGMLITCFFSYVFAVFARAE